MDTFDIIKAMKTTKIKTLEVSGRSNEIGDDGSISFTDGRSGKKSSGYGHNSHGYRATRINGKNIPMHRLVAKAFFHKLLRLRLLRDRLHHVQHLR